MKRFGLSADKRIKSRKDFDTIYTSGKSLFSTDKKIKAIYTKENSEKGEVKMAVVVSKKAGNAVWRNRIKRLVRESFRVNNQKINETAKRNRIALKIVLSPVALSQKQNKKVYLNEIMPQVVEVLAKLEYVI